MRAPKSFEDGLARLQGILEKLQSEDTPLADSVKLYAEAAELIRYCSGTLNSARLQIEEIDASLTKQEEGVS